MREPSPSMGFLLVDKPAGPTSHDVVAAAKRALGGVKVGHAGTLDPFATGLLVLGTGRATRLLEHLVGLDKEYEAVARFGAATDTHDHLGAVVSTDDRWRELGEERVRVVARGLVGRLSQTPPAYSAIKVRGVPAHRRTRRGETVRLAPRTVTVRALDVLTVEPPDVRLRLSCSSGTYVRSLAAELGDRLGTGCHLTALRRTRVGDFHVADAASLESVTAARPPENAWLAAPDALAHLPRVRVGPEAAAKLVLGQKVDLDQAAVEPPAGGHAGCASGQGEGPVVVLLHDGTLAAVATVTDGVLKPRKVFRHGS